MIADAIAAVLPELRAQAESRMTSACIVRRLTGATVPDASGRQVPEWTQVHVGPLRLGGVSGGTSPSRGTSPPGGAAQVAQRVAHLPSSVAHLVDGDLIEVTSGECAGTVWRVIESDPADQQTARRLPVTAVQRPTEWGAL